MTGLGDVLDRRCRKAIAVVLSIKEREADPFLPADVKAHLRKVILDQLNDFCAIATDIVESTQDSVVMNELWLRKIEEIHAAVTAD